MDTFLAELCQNIVDVEFTFFAETWYSQSWRQSWTFFFNYLWGHILDLFVIKGILEVE